MDEITCILECERCGDKSLTLMDEGLVGMRLECSACKECGHAFANVSEAEPDLENPDILWSVLCIEGDA